MKYGTVCCCGLVVLLLGVAGCGDRRHIDGLASGVDTYALMPVLGVYGFSVIEATGEPAGVIVKVMANYPAAIGGVLTGDIIVSVNGQQVLSIAQIIAVLRSAKPGHPAQIQVDRRGVLHEMTVHPVYASQAMRPHDDRGMIFLPRSFGRQWVESLSASGACLKAGGF